jgi:hypothetical protein
MARNLRESLSATLLLAFLAVSTAGAQPPTTTTDQFSGSETFSGEGCRGETADITDEWTAVIHTTLFDDGRLHIAGTMAIDISWTQSGVIYTGHATSSFAQNSNNRAFNGIIMLNGQGNGSDGSKFSSGLSFTPPSTPTERSRSRSIGFQSSVGNV